MSVSSPTRLVPETFALEMFQDRFLVSGLMHVREHESRDLGEIIGYCFTLGVRELIGELREKAPI